MTPGDALPGALRRHRDQPDPPVSEGQIRTTADREAADPQFRKPNAVQSDSAAVTGATMNPLFATLSLSLCQMIHQVIARPAVILMVPLPVLHAHTSDPRKYSSGFDSCHSLQVSFLWLNLVQQDKKGNA